jgi:hypothetical protein
MAMAPRGRRPAECRSTRRKCTRRWTCSTSHRHPIIDRKLAGGEYPLTVSARARLREGERRDQLHREAVQDRDRGKSNVRDVDSR